MRARSEYEHLKPAFEPQALKLFLASHFVLADYEAKPGAEPRAVNFSGVRLGAADVYFHEASGFHYGHRRPQHYRADHVDDFLISLPLRGQTSLMQARHQSEVGVGAFIISSTSKPLAVTSQSGPGGNTFQTFHVRVSGSMLRARVPHIDRCCQTPIHLRSGAGAIMASLFDLAIREASSLNTAQAQDFGSMLVSAVANATLDAPELFRVNPAKPLSADERIRELALQFVAGKLSDPMLDPSLVATHCGVSVRRLHAAFATAPQTRGQLIRETRLEYCRKALRSAALSNQSVFEIALRWGFNDPSHFSRAYKTHYGTTPNHDRRSSLASTGS